MAYIAIRMLINTVQILLSSTDLYRHFATKEHVAHHLDGFPSAWSGIARKQGGVCSLCFTWVYRWCESCELRGFWATGNLLFRYICYLRPLDGSKESYRSYPSC